LKRLLWYRPNLDMISPVSFDNQGILVVGGTQGIAPAVILLAAQRKATVVFAAPRGCEAAANQLVAAAQAAGLSDRVSCLITELADEEAVEQLADAALERLPSLDVLIHNLETAAVLEHRPLVDISLAEWNRVLSSELRIPFMLARRVVEEYLVSRVNGRIAYIAYSGSEGGTPSASYAAAQTGLRALVRCITKEFGRREVACNAVIIHQEGRVTFPSSLHLLPDRSEPEHPVVAPNELVETLLFLVSR
jgi:gluconate 5-dehydrogenase